MRRASSGFTLLEVMISLSILALALTAIAGINANSFNASNYAKHITVATLLARSKMVDIEEELRKDGFGSDDREFSGDFNEEGYESMRWEAVSRKVELDVSQLIGGFLGGDITADSIPEQMKAFLGGIQGGGGEAGADPALAGAEQPSLKALLEGGGGASENIMETMFRQMGETLANSIREIELTIKWGEEGTPNEETLTFVQYLTTTGRVNISAGGAGLPGLPPGIIPGGANPGQAGTGQAGGGLNPPAQGSRPGTVGP